VTEKDEIVLRKELEKPAIPENWDYEESVKRLKSIVYKWRKLTEEILQELYIARAILAVNPSDAAKIMHGANAPRITWAKYCNEIGIHRSTANRWLLRYGSAQMRLESPKGNFDIIYADPPWKYDFSISTSRAIESHYPSMNIEDIKAMSIPDSTDAVLFLWATAPKLLDALEVMAAWGFQYKTHAVWNKMKIGMGYWFRGQHELLLIGTKGKGIPPDTTNRYGSVIEEKRTEKHSRKPEKIYEIIEAMFPTQKKIELFATKKRKGWISWGLDIGKD